MFAYDLFFSVATGFMGSLLVVVYLYRLRPRIEISPYIAEQQAGSQPTYGFKIINRTHYPVVDVRMELVLITPTNVHGGPVKSAKAIPLLRDTFFQLGPFSLKDKDADYALRVGCIEDLKVIWTSETQDLRLNVIAKHALSGFCSISTHTYHTKSVIKQGKHIFGNNLEVQAVA